MGVMQQYLHENQLTAKIIALHERLLLAELENELLHEQIEFWRELVESNKLEWCAQQQQQQELQKELLHTNRDLCDAINYQNQEFDSAVESAQKILTLRTSASESLAALLVAIYGCAVKPEDLEQIELSRIRATLVTNAEAKNITANSQVLRERSQQLREQIQAHRERSQQLREQYQELGFRYVSFRASFREFCQRVSKFKPLPEEKNQQLPESLLPKD